MPQGSGSDEGGSLMPKLIEIQSKLSQMESQLGSVPSDLLDKISAMQKAIDGLQAELTSVRRVYIIVLFAFESFTCPYYH